MGATNVPCSCGLIGISQGSIPDLVISLSKVVPIPDQDRDPYQKEK